jgi:hypothetical protein
MSSIEHQIEHHQNLQSPSYKPVNNSTFPYFGTLTLEFPSERSEDRRYLEWKDGTTPFEISDEVMRESDVLARARRPKIKAAMEHAWGGYRTYAFGENEVHPISGNTQKIGGMMGSLFGKDQNNGIGITLIDSLDTLWIMDMKKEFWEARDWVRDQLKHDVDEYLSVFETTIRNLGGLLSAYDLSEDKVFLDRAKELGDKLILAFNTKSGIPLSQVNLYSNRAGNKPWEKVYTSLADSALQVEFRNLSRMTGNAMYAEKAEHVIKALQEITPPNGIHSALVNNIFKHAKLKTTHYLTKMTFGGLADSFFEYLLKTWIQGGKKESMYRDMYDTAVQGLHDELIYLSSPSGFLFLREKHFVLKGPKKKRDRKSRTGRRRRRRKNGKMISEKGNALGKAVSFEENNVAESDTMKDSGIRNKLNRAIEENDVVEDAGKGTFGIRVLKGRHPGETNELKNPNNETKASWRPVNTMDHLTCFAGGKFAFDLETFIIG